MLNCPHAEKTKNYTLSVNLIIKQIKPRAGQGAVCCQTIMTSVQSALTNRNSGSGSSTSSRCMHKIKVFFQTTKNLRIFTSSKGFNIHQKQTFLLDSAGPSWRLASSDLRAKSEFLPLYHLAVESTAARKVQLSEAATSWPTKQTELSTPSTESAPQSCQLLSSCPLCHLRYLQVLQFQLEFQNFSSSQLFCR